MLLFYNWYLRADVAREWWNGVARLVLYCSVENGLIRHPGAEMLTYPSTVISHDGRCLLWWNTTFQECCKLSLQRTLYLEGSLIKIYFVYNFWIAWVYKVQTSHQAFRFLGNLKWMKGIQIWVSEWIYFSLAWWINREILYVPSKIK